MRRNRGGMRGDERRGETDGVTGCEGSEGRPRGGGSMQDDMKIEE